MRVREGLSTSVGRKILVALTGLALAGFLLLHLAGNLLLFAGPESFNGYAHVLISNPLLVPAEVGLAAVFLLHAYQALRHTWAGRRARPERYARLAWAGGDSRKTWSSATMAVSGVVTLVFVVLHLKTFKYGPSYASAEAGVRDLYTLVLEVFRQPLYVAFYVAAMALLGMHLRHGLSSAVQSLGAAPAGWTKGLLVAGAALAGAVAAGFAAIPLWVLFTQ